MPKSIRRIATTRNMATPRATARINVRFGIDGTCWARTCKSGSDIVIKKPITKLTKITIKRFLDLVMMVPVLSPIGVMDTSTPTLKNNIPIINKMAPIKKVIRILGGIGAMVKQSNKTMASMGMTAFRVSVNFSLNLEWKKINVSDAFLQNLFSVYHKMW